MHSCGFHNCDKVGTIFMMEKHGIKFWYCVEHYDRMAAFYQREQHNNDPWAVDMVNINGW